MTCPWCSGDENKPTCVDIDPEEQNPVDVVSELIKDGFKIVCVEVGKAVRWHHGFLWNTEKDFYRVWIHGAHENLI